MTGVLMGAISCSDDEPSGVNTVFSVNTPMINHIYNTVTGTVLGISNTHNFLTIDTALHTASLDLRYNDGNGEKTLSLKNLSAKPKGIAFYELSDASNSQFKGYVDFGEGSMRYIYTTSEGIRVISTTPEIFFRKTNNTISYDDTTETTVMESTMYQFEVAPSTLTSSVQVMDIEHAKDLKRFYSIKGSGANVTLTPNGYVIQGDTIKTTAMVYRNWMDITSGVIPTTDKYPLIGFNATVDLLNDSLNATFKIGSSATVVSTGRTYPSYTYKQ